MAEAALKYEEDSSQESTFAEFSTVFERFLQSRTNITGSMIGPDTVDRRRSLPQKYPLWDVKIDRVPLPVSVQHEEDGWSADLEWLNIYGFGESPEEAIEEVSQHIIHFVEFYKNASQDQLTGYAQTLKERFDRIELN